MTHQYTLVLCNKKWVSQQQVNRKPFNSITEHIQTDRQGKLLTTDTDTFLHNLSDHPKEYNLAACTEDGQK